MNIGLLGEFELECRGAAHKLPPRCRSVLCGLALRASCSMSMEQLVSWVWNKEDLPRRPDSALQTYICRIRSSLGSEAGRLRTLTDGYLLEIDTSSVDALKFEENVITALSSPSGAADVDAITRAPRWLSLAGALTRSRCIEPYIVSFVTSLAWSRARRSE